MLRKFCTYLPVGMGAFFLIAPWANAQELDSVQGDWYISSVTRDGGKFCYVFSAPTDFTGTFSKRSKPYAMVTEREATVDEVSVSSGYPYKASSKVKIAVDNKPFELFIKDETAWADNEAQDAAIVTAMKKGNKMTVRGTSVKDTFSLDTYSLKGFTAAYKRMKELCQ